MKITYTDVKGYLSVHPEMMSNPVEVVVEAVVADKQKKNELREAYEEMGRRYAKYRDYAGSR